jgi:quinol monooxygenase YgiN
MFVHIWRMRARKKRVEEYEKFGRQLTLPSLKKIDGCIGAHFVKIFQSRKPEYLWLVFWKDHDALEKARTNALWREQIKRFEAGKFCKSIPIEYVCEGLDSFTASAPKPKRPSRPGKAVKAAPPEEPEETAAEEAAPSESSPQGFRGPTVEGE